MKKGNRRRILATILLFPFTCASTLIGWAMYVKGDHPKRRKKK